MTDGELAAIEARANAAPVGPWRVKREYYFHVADSPNCQDTCGAGQVPALIEERGGQILHAHDDWVVEDIVAPGDEHLMCWGHDYDDYGGTIPEVAEFAAAAREDVPALLTEVRRLRADLEAQWEENHFEHCGRPHGPEKDCMWPRPDSLPARQPSETVVE